MVAYLTRSRAAEHITECGIPTSSQALADLAHRGEGPKYAIVRGRAVYRLVDLDNWLAAHFEHDAKVA